MHTWTHINVCRVSCGGVSNMLLVLSITFYFHYNIWGCMCLTGTFKYRWLKGYICSTCYYHHQIGSIHLSHWFIFSLVVSLRWLLHHILSLTEKTFRENREFVFISIVQLRWVQIVGYVLARRSYLFVCTLHHLIIDIMQTLSEDIELIKCLSDIICWVCE